MGEKPIKVSDTDIREAVSNARQYKENDADEFIIWLFDRTPITDELLLAEGFVRQPKLMMEKGDHRIIPWVEDDNSECFVLFSGTSDNHGIKVRNMGELRRAMTIGKDW